MPWDNRSYYRDRPPASLGMIGTSGFPVTIWLIGLCIGVFVLDAVLGRAMGQPSPIGNGPFTHWGAFSATDGLFRFQVWRFFTFQFLHTGLFHILFNCIVLYFFGRIIEPALGLQRYLAFYLLCGIGGAALYLTLLVLGLSIPGAPQIPGLLVTRPDATLVGASAGCYGIMVAAAVLYPHETVRLWLPPISLTIRTLVLILIGLSAFFLLVGEGPNVGGEAAHLGGAGLAFLFMRFPVLLNWVPERSLRWRIPFLPKKDWASKQARLDRQRMKEEAEVDRILAKVRASGLHSLNRGEKKTLQRATERSVARDA